MTTLISVSGSPSTATRSAKWPGAIARSPEWPSSAAGIVVAVATPARASSHDEPERARACSARHRVTASEPIPSFTSARKRGRRLQVLLDVGLERWNRLGREAELVLRVDVVAVVIDGRHPDRAALHHVGDSRRRDRCRVRSESAPAHGVLHAGRPHEWNATGWPSRAPRRPRLLSSNVSVCVVSSSAAAARTGTASRPASTRASRAGDSQGRASARSRQPRRRRTSAAPNLPVDQIAHRVVDFAEAPVVAHGGDAGLERLPGIRGEHRRHAGGRRAG